MRRVSPGYHAVTARQEDGRTKITCLDLRTRSFGGVFGKLELTFDSAGRLERKVFHV